MGRPLNAALFRFPDHIASFPGSGLGTATGLRVTKGYAILARQDNFKEDSMADISVQVLDNGPLLVTGEFDLQDGSGGGMTKDEGRPIALCRCGQSDDKPFCDGSHKNCGFSSSVKA